MLHEHYAALKQGDLTQAHIQPYAQAMEQYVGPLQQLEDRMRTGVPAKEVPGYLGSGSYKHTFAAQGPDGPVAVKYLYEGDRWGTPTGEEPLLHQPGQPLTTELHREIAPLIAGAGMMGNGHEKLLAADPARGIMVTTLGEGKRITDVAPRAFKNMDTRHILSLDYTLQQLAKHGLHPHNAEGVLYAPDKGFFLSDYAFKGYPTNKKPMDPENGVRPFLEYVLDDFAAIRRASPPDWMDPRDYKHFKPPRIRRSWERMRARDKVLRHVGSIVLQ